MKMSACAFVFASVFALLLGQTVKAAEVEHDLQGPAAVCATEQGITALLEGLENLKDAKLGATDLFTPSIGASRLPASLELSPIEQAVEAPQPTVESQCHPLEFAPATIAFRVNEPESSRLSTMTIELATGQVTVSQVSAERGDECRFHMKENERLALKEAFAEPIVLCPREEPEALATQLTLIGARKSQSESLINPSDATLQLNMEFSQLEADLKDLMMEVLATGQCVSEEPEMKPYRAE